MTDDCKWGLVAVKRRWIPHFVFAMFRWVIIYQPFRWIFTTDDPKAIAEAKERT